MPALGSVVETRTDKSVSIIGAESLQYFKLECVKCSLCTDPLSKGGKGLCNYEPKLADRS